MNDHHLTCFDDPAALASARTVGGAHAIHAIHAIHAEAGHAAEAAAHAVAHVSTHAARAPKAHGHENLREVNAIHIHTWERELVYTA